jgi:hypothetical protein
MAKKPEPPKPISWNSYKIARGLRNGPSGPVAWSGVAFCDQTSTPRGLPFCAFDLSGS